MENAMKNEYVKQVEEFRFYCLWGAWPGEERWDSKEMKFKLSVRIKEDVLLAVNKAYYDMTPRTIKNFAINIEDKNSNIKKYKESQLEIIKDSLADSINDTFINKEFSEKEHRKICDDFLDLFNELIIELNNKLEGIKGNKGLIEKICFGKAQKIVNMTYKYLLLFDDAFDDGNEDIFKLCHMAIDSFILSHYKKIEINKEEKKKICNIAWSNMDKDTYYDLQKNIENYVNDQPPIFAEFDWWRDEQRKKSEK